MVPVYIMDHIKTYVTQDNTSEMSVEIMGTKPPFYITKTLSYQQEKKSAPMCTG